MYDSDVSLFDPNLLFNRYNADNYLGRNSGLSDLLSRSGHGRNGFPCRRRDCLDLSNSEAASNKPVANDTTSSESSYYRRTTLDLQLNLSFDFKFISSVAKKVESGELGTTEAIEQIIYSEFGISADFSASGTDQIIQSESTSSNGASRAVNSYNRNSNAIRNSNSAFFSANRRTNSFMQTIQSFKLRYSKDATFQFSKFTRFLDQTQRLDSAQPDSTEGYFDSTRSLVDTSTESSLSLFFDAVDSYLAGFEDELRSNIDGFFDDIEQLSGFSSDAINAARENFDGALDTFFNAVSGVMDSIRPDSADMNTVQKAAEAPSTENLDLVT